MLSKSKASLVLLRLTQPSTLSGAGSEGESQLQFVYSHKACSFTLPSVGSRVTTVAAGPGFLSGTLAVVLASLHPGLVVK